jgi:exopolysaccharide biosynthesis protein
MKKIIIVIALLSLVSDYSYAQSAKKQGQKKTEIAVKATTIVPALSLPDQNATVIDTRNQPVSGTVQPQISTTTSTESLSVQPVTTVKETQQNTIKKNPKK